MSTTETEHEPTQFFKSYYRDAIGELAQRYPNDQKYLRVDWSDLATYDRELAMDYLKAPDKIEPILQNAVADVPLPIENNLGDAEIRMVGLNESDTYSPLEVTRDAEQREEAYIGVRGELSKVTEPKKEITEAAFACVRCGCMTYVPQGRNGFQEPHECAGCERQGPFEIDFDESAFTDHVRVRVETPPDESGKLQEQSIDGEVRGDLVWSGGEDFGLAARTGDRVVVYGTVEKRQVTEGNSKTRHFDEYLNVQAIEFDDDADDVKVEEHRDEFEALAERPDAVDVFADSIAPQLYATKEWEFALEALVAYLFGSPRVNIPEGPTIRGDIHVLIVSDYGMGKSMVNEAIADFSPQVIKESVTGMSSDVGLLAAAVEDDFGEGQWTLEPGILVRANGGHVILDEIDKTDADLERMNDALEGEQLVDVNKAGQSATFKSRVGLLATGNPKQSRFDDTLPVADQLGIDQSLLSRFDAIVTMEDTPTREKDHKVAEAQGISYVEAQEYDQGKRDGFDHLSREVEPQVGRAWVAYARDQVNPQLRREHVDTIRDWYADEVRPLNEKFGNDGGGDMPVRVSARSVMDTIRFAVAFARVHLRDEVADADVERAMSLTQALVGQDFGNGGATDQEDWLEGVHAAIEELQGEHPAKEDAVYTEAGDSGVPVGKIEWAINKLKERGEVYEPEDAAYRVT